MRIISSRSDADEDLRSGKAVRFCTPAIEPQGGVLSASADQTLSGGHMKAAGPILAVVEGASSALTLEATKAKIAVRTVMRAIFNNYSASLLTEIGNRKCDGKRRKNQCSNGRMSLTLCTRTALREKMGSCRFTNLMKYLHF